MCESFSAHSFTSSSSDYRPHARNCVGSIKNVYGFFRKWIKMDFEVGSRSLRTNP